MEVAQHIGHDTARCFMLAPSEGIGRGMEVISTGGPITVPVGKPVLGRMFNVLGESIDGKGASQDLRAVVHPPSGPAALPTRVPWWTSLRRASRSSTCWLPTPAAVRSACSAALAWAKPC
ncbi:MAG: hypothetical protein ACLTR8_03400 [Oscillospiraceae bacterium]